MANIAHSVLTGSDLHESKGAAAATAGQVAIANGSGNAIFGLIGTSSLGPTGNPFGAALFHVREQQASGTSGQSSTTAGWQQRKLTTVVTNDTGVPTLSSNQVSLPAGTYFCVARAISGASSSAFTVNFQLKLFNVTGAADLILGSTMNAFGNTTFQGNIESTLFGRFTLGGTSTLEFRGWNNSASQAFPNTTGTNEIYTDGMFWKVA